MLKDNGGNQSLFLPPHGTTRAGLLLGFALGSHSLHRLLYGFLITEERHGLNRLQVCVQLIHNWDSCGQVQLHDGCIRHIWKDRQISRQNRVNERHQKAVWGPAMRTGRKEVLHNKSRQVFIIFSLYFKLFSLQQCVTYKEETLSTSFPHTSP